MKSEIERGRSRHAMKALLRLCASVALFGTATALMLGGVISPAYSQLNGFIYNNGTYTTLSNPSGTNTLAFGINNLGQVVGSYNTIPNCACGNYQYGFLYSNGTYTTLNKSGGTSPATEAFGINDAGLIVGMFRNAAGTADYGFLYNNGSYTTLSAPAAPINTWATDINNFRSDRRVN